jgi:hypothetical protein
MIWLASAQFPSAKTSSLIRQSDAIVVPRSYRTWKASLTASESYQILHVMRYFENQ